jgi:hypothetical protein
MGAPQRTLIPMVRMAKTDDTHFYRPRLFFTRKQELFLHIKFQKSHCIQDLGVRNEAIGSLFHCILRESDNLGGVNVPIGLVGGRDLLNIDRRFHGRQAVFIFEGEGVDRFLRIEEGGGEKENGEK